MIYSMKLPLTKRIVSYLIGNFSKIFRIDINICSIAIKYFYENLQLHTINE